MKRLAIFILIPILLISCEIENLWQRLNITKKPELHLILPSVEKIEKTDSKVDLAKLFSDNPSVSFNVRVGDEFTMKILGQQDKTALGNMVERLLSKAFSKEEIESFLLSKITNSEITLALKGNAQLLKATKHELINLFSCIPQIEDDEESIESYLKELGLDSNEENKKIARDLIYNYNYYISNVKTALSSFINNLFQPLEDYVNVNSYLWKDYIRIQLTTNITASVIDALAQSFSEISFDLTNKEDLNALFAYIQQKSIESVYHLALNIVQGLINPLAGMDQLASRYKQQLELPDLADLINLAMGGGK